MRNIKHSDQLLVGSVPLGSAREVFSTCCDYIGDNLSFLPDGEFGDRILWHNYLARYVYNGHPDIETHESACAYQGLSGMEAQEPHR